MVVVLEFVKSSARHEIECIECLFLISVVKPKNCFRAEICASLHILSNKVKKKIIINIIIY